MKMNRYIEATPEQIAEGRAAINASGTFEGTDNFVVSHGDGALMYGTDGREMIDCTAQAWSLNLGFHNEKVIEAVKQQLNCYTNVRPTAGIIPKYLLAARIAKLAPEGLNKLDFNLHGSLATEGALKMALRAHPERKNVMSLYDGYHGRTLAGISLSWPHPNNGFLQYMNNAVRVPQAYCYRCKFGYDDCSKCGLACAQFMEHTIENAVDGGVAGIFIEPIQGNGGMIDMPASYLKEVRRICDKHDIVLIFDEVQCAFGRVGRMFTSELHGVTPDIITFGKAVGGGFPLAGTISKENLMMCTADHGFTFGSFAPSMVAALAYLDVVEEEDLLKATREKGDYITKRLKEMQGKYEIIGDIRGPGLMIGIELVKDKKTKEPYIKGAEELVKEGVKRGVQFGDAKYGAKSSVVKIKPALVITYEADRPRTRGFRAAN